MKVLFLDINGVLCLGYTGTLDQGALLELCRIHDATGCLIVLASSWRGSEKRIARVQEALRQFGIPALVGMTGHTGDRGEEILAWVRAWNDAVSKGSMKLLDPPVETFGWRREKTPEYSPALLEAATKKRPERIAAWVSVDDEPALKRRIPQNLVMTNTQKGLTREDGDRAIMILSQVAL